MNESSPLDNPAWHALTETQHAFAIDEGNIQFYQPDICAFGGFTSPENITAAMSGYAAITDDFFIIGNQPPLPPTLQLKNELVCLQMVCADRLAIPPAEKIILLDSTHREAIFALVNLVQPGYFKMKTSLLGQYYGLFQNGQLVAVTGERMQMNDYTEVSAVVTHPQHTGQGYARQLVAHAVNNIFAAGKTPMLHVTATNTGAIRLYEKLGFKTRRQISFWQISRSVD